MRLIDSIGSKLGPKWRVSVRQRPTLEFGSFGIQTLFMKKKMEEEHLSLNLRRFESSLVEIQNGYRTRIVCTSWQHFVVGFMIEIQNLLVWEWEILKAPQHLGLLSTVSTSLTMSPKTHVFGSSYILQFKIFQRCSF